MLNKEKHEDKMIDVLSDIYRNRILSSRLGFKGGTACYLLHGLTRFSVDLGFDIIGDYEEAEINLLFDELKKVLSGHGKFEEARIKHYTIFFLLNYESNLHNLKIEVSKRKTNDKYDLKSFLGIRIPVMVEQDMFAHKLVALTDRKQLANRDLFDLHWMFSRKWEINEEIVKDLTGNDLRSYLEEVVDFIENKVPRKFLLAGLGELVDDKQKFWVKNRMLEELKVLIERRLFLMRER